jgi:hypothetical protein
MGFPQKSASVATLNLSGVKNGLRAGMKLNTAAIDAEKINETDYLYSF